MTRRSTVELSVVGNRWETGRLEAFSDGVFAIAITLLVLEISVPAEAFDDLWSGILHEWPAYLGYVTSFLTIGALWLAHHGVFRRLRYANNNVMRINLLLLMAVAFLPFPTKLVAEANEQGLRGRLVGSATPDVVQPGTAVEVTFLVPAKGVERWSIFVDTGPDTVGLVGWSDVPPPCSIHINEEGGVGWTCEG